MLTKKIQAELKKLADTNRVLIDLNSQAAWEQILENWKKMRILEKNLIFPLFRQKITAADGFQFPHATGLISGNALSVAYRSGLIGFFGKKPKKIVKKIFLPKIQIIIFIPFSCS